MSDTESLTSQDSFCIEPPMSLISKIVFHNVRDHYPIGQQLICEISSENNEPLVINAETDDIIGLYNVPYVTSQEYIASIFVPSSFDGSKTKLSFEVDCLPKEEDVYILQYLKKDGFICGATAPFFLRDSKETKINEHDEFLFVQSPSMMSNEFRESYDDMQKQLNRLTNLYEDEKFNYSSVTNLYKELQKEHSTCENLKNDLTDAVEAKLKLEAENFDLKKLNERKDIELRDYKDESEKNMKLMKSLQEFNVLYECVSQDLLSSSKETPFTNKSLSILKDLRVSLDAILFHIIPDERVYEMKELRKEIDEKKQNEILLHNSIDALKYHYGKLLTKFKENDDKYSSIETAYQSKIHSLQEEWRTLHKSMSENQKKESDLSEYQHFLKQDNFKFHNLENKITELESNLKDLQNSHRNDVESIKLKFDTLSVSTTSVDEAASLANFNCMDFRCEEVEENKEKENENTSTTEMTYEESEPQNFSLLNCPICNECYQCDSVNEMEFHVESHLATTRACPMCTEVFAISEQKELKTHVYGHFREEDEFLYNGAPRSWDLGID